MAAAASAIQPLSVTSHAVHTLSAYLRANGLVLPTIFLLLSCSLVYPCMTIVFMDMSIPGVSSSMFVLCVWIANLL